MEAIVIDNGSGFCKAGFAGDEAPRAVIPSVVGKPKRQGTTSADTYVGAEALDKRGDLYLRHPISHGRITDWDDMEKFWHHTFYNELRVSPETSDVLLTESALTPKSNREKMAQIMFETFKVPSLNVSVQAELSMIATGRDTGVVLDIGDQVTQAVPIIDGSFVREGTIRLGLGGRDLTDYMARLLSERGYSMATSDELAIASDIKEKLAFVALDFDGEFYSTSCDKTYELPDGNTISIGNERFRVPEPLFKPTMIGREIDGIPTITYNSVEKCDSSMADKLLSNIVLCGGSSMFPNMVERMKQELKDLVPSSTKIKIIAEPERNHSAWMGGSMKASMSGFSKALVTKQEYDEHGPAAIHRRPTMVDYAKKCLDQSQVESIPYQISPF